ncbi:MAG: stage III sporulation protein AA [Clostridiales bacterium]|nr:stage III sporulation protein AA [Clostridiales bacterium]
MQQIIRLFPPGLRERLEKCGVFALGLEEIRVRVNEYLMFRTAEGEMFLRGAHLVKEADASCFCPGPDDMEQMCTFMCKYSLYAYEEEMRQGFLTVEGGHRIGISGQVLAEEGRIRRIYPVSYLNIRIAAEHKGCAESVFPYLYKQNDFYSTLILSAPGVGKTTLLRDVVRLASDGAKGFSGKKVCLVDERSEIAGCIRGVPQNEIGMRTDVLDGCPKAEGMMLMVRSMSPEILAVDEIGGEEDLKALRYALRCGCRAVGTIHSRDLTELRDKPGWRSCLEEKLFSRYVVLNSAVGVRTYHIFDESGRLLR